MTDGTMIFIGMIFVTVFMLAQGMVIPAFGESRQAQKRLRKRLSEMDKEGGQESLSSLLRQKYLRSLSPWERTLERLPAMAALSQIIEQSGGTILAYRLTLLALGAGVATAVVAWIFTHMIVAVILGALVVGSIPFVKVFRNRTQRIQKLEEQLPDAVDMVKRALRAGHPFAAAIKLVGEEMDAPVGKEFETTFADINYGNDVRRAMLGLLQRVPSVSVMAVVTAVLVQKETGGNLAEILEQIAKVIRGRFRLQRTVKTLSAEGRLSAWVLAMVPLVLFVVIWFTTPTYLPTLVEDPFGRKLVAYGFVSGVIGIYWIRRIIRIEV